MKPTALQLGRICAICGKRRSPSGEKSTYGFHTALRRAGYSWPADKAHRECVANLPKVQAKTSR